MWRLSSVIKFSVLDVILDELNFAFVLNKYTLNLKFDLSDV